jgi:hypothetical protein
MAVELDRLAILVVNRRFHGMGVMDSRSLRSDNYVRMNSEGVCSRRRSIYVPFRRFLVDDVCTPERSCNAFPLLFMARTLGSYLSLV